MKCFLFFGGVFTVFALIYCDVNKEESIPVVDKKTVAHSILGNVDETLSKRYRFHSCGVGEATHKDDNLYKEMGLLFKVQGPISKEEGRRILVDSVQEFLRQVNTHPDFRQFMHVYPFTPENIDITFFVSDKDRRGVFYPDIRVFAARRGKVTYQTKSSEQEYGYYTDEEETWDEALQEVK